MKGKLAGGVVGVLISLVAALTTRAADPISSASLTGAVTIATTDGHAVKGTLQSVTPELLTVLPTPKPVPKAKAGVAPVDPPKSDPVELPWNTVKRVSNGLTARLALDVWKAQHSADLCPTCRGERTVWCPTCKGTNHDPAAAADCKTCHGELLVACKSRGEVAGVVPCPNGCLRLGVGRWAKDKNGENWCSFKVSALGTHMYSEHHIGDVIFLDLKNHAAPDLGVCPVCGGTTKIDDPTCHGTGKVPCPECLARKAAAAACPNHCDGGRVVCPDCGGTGLKKPAGANGVNGPNGGTDGGGGA